MRELKAVSLTRSLVGTKNGVMRCLELRVEGSYPLKSRISESGVVGQTWAKWAVSWQVLPYVIGEEPREVLRFI